MTYVYCVTNVSVLLESLTSLKLFAIIPISQLHGKKYFILLPKHRNLAERGIY